MSGARAIYEERERQKHSEGWTPEHDAQHTDNSLAMAAVAYAAPEPVYVLDADSEDMRFHFLDVWPDSWDIAWDKRGQIDRRRSLVIAGALIAAEIDRIDHATRNSE